MSEIVSSRPVMDDGGFECFKERLAGSTCYLEYGCGGSTVYACNEAKLATVISVESDRDWAKNVRDSLSGSQSTLRLEWCDIGEVGDWGTPKNRNKLDNFWKYMATPWIIAKTNSWVPDTVLIDGRFRVACFLYSLISARLGTTILFDDYFDRPHYFVVEEFCRISARRGRMGVFSVSHQYSTTDIAARIAQYSVIWA